jgi:FSR family fosmidomycin resistance protein-like MFS transporter
MKDQSSKSVRFKTMFSNLMIYASSHAVVDATCAAMILSLSRIHGIDFNLFSALVLFYNIVAFGFQVPFGLMTDRWHLPVFSAIVGCVLTALSTTVLFSSVMVAVFLAGIGNALFHVGGGTVSLNLTPERPVAPGIFVAPGALGIFAGTIIGQGGYFVSWPFVVLLLMLCIAMLVTEAPRFDYDHKKNQKTRSMDWHFFELIILLVLSSIAVRSLVGLATVLPWKSVFTLSMTLTAAVVLGKALGGVLADKSGWIRLGIMSLLISAPMLSFGATIPCFAIVGMFLFNITMPITLTAVSNMLPGRPGFSFGLTCLALIVGALPTFTTFKTMFANEWVMLALIFASTAALFYGLHFFSREFPFREIAGRS